MDTNKKEKKHVLGIIGGLIFGLIFVVLTAFAYIYVDFIGMLGMLMFIGFFEYWGYKLFRGKIDKNTPFTIAILSVVNVVIMSFIVIPTALLIKSNIPFSIKEVCNLYENSKISLNIFQDFLIALVLSVFSSYIIGNIISKKVKLKVEKIRLFSADNKEKQEYKEKAIEETKEIFKNLNATQKDKAVRKEDIFEKNNSKDVKQYVNYLYSLRIIKKYKGKYYYCEESESNIKIHCNYWKGAIATVITVILIAGILLSFGLINQSNKKFYNKDISFSINNTWNEYKTTENTSTDDDEIDTKQSWIFYKYMNATSTSDEEEHSYPEMITVSYGDNSFGADMKINDLRNLIEGYFYEYMGFNNYQIEVSTSDNGYDTLEAMIGYEDSMEFSYYLLNGDKIAFISASTTSTDEDLYDALEEYTKEVVNSFKWN